jgi:hypothetical protein
VKGNKDLILILCILSLITYAGIHFFDDDRKVVSLVKQDNSKSDIEILEGNNYVKMISEFGMIDNISWINENIVQFKEKKTEDKYVYYKFDYASKELKTVNPFIETDKNFNDLKGDINFIKKINKDNYLIYVEKGKDQGLFYIRDKRKIKLAQNIEYNDKLKFKLSKNNKKIVFYDKEQNSIKVYDLLDNKEVVLDQELNNILLNNFESYMNFSPNAGYIAVSYINNKKISESYFSIFGADSGKIYAEKIMGLNPVWANNNLSVAYIYVGHNAKFYTSGLNEIKIAGKKIGIFNLRTRKIQYTQPLDDSVQITSPIMWTKDDKRILFTIGDISIEANKFHIKGICYYEIYNKMFVNLEEYFTKDIVQKDDVELIFKNDNYFIVTSSKSRTNFIKVIDLNNKGTKNYENLQAFTTNSDEGNITAHYKYLSDDKFIYIKTNCIYLNDRKSNNLIYKTEGTIRQIYESPDRTKLFVLSQLNGKIELAVINI